jgi:OmpA-OmpF porin, OOP family
VGQAHVNKGPYNDHPTTYAINGGYRWKVGEDLGLGVDVGYNDLGNFKLKNAFNDNPVNLKDQRNALRGWTAGVNGKINVWQGLYVSGRTGVYGWKGHGYANQDINRHDLDKVDYYAGAGVGYDINSHFGVGLAYDYYHAKKDGISLSTDTASLTAEYRF